MARLLPRRLATVLPTTYSPTSLESKKDIAMRCHSGFPCQAFTQFARLSLLIELFGKVLCKGFAPAAPRRACTHVSECISGLSLSRPVRIIALLSSYLNNELIRRSPILRCKSFQRRCLPAIIAYGVLRAVSGINHIIFIFSTLS